jgi:hypothetical protein
MKDEAVLSLTIGISLFGWPIIVALAVWSFLAE